MRKAPAWSAAVTPTLEAEVYAWARRRTSAGEAGREAAADDPAQHPIQ